MILAPNERLLFCAQRGYTRRACQALTEGTDNLDQALSAACVRQHTATAVAMARHDRIQPLSYWAVLSAIVQLRDPSRDVLYRGWSLLHHTCWMGRGNSTRVLLEAGADDRRRTTGGPLGCDQKTPYDLAVMADHKDCCDLLARHQARRALQSLMNFDEHTDTPHGF